MAEPEPVPPPPPPPPPPPAPVEPAVRLPQVLEPEVAVIVSDRKPAYENVATELGQYLENYAVYNLRDPDQSPVRIFRSVSESETRAVIAIGLRAALAAKALSDVPVVFCQVFNVLENDLLSEDTKGIAAIPPLELQLKAWKEVDPSLKNIGAILGDGHDDLIAEATRATDANDINLHLRTAKSDKETLYVFNRLIPEIDGFWLFPDNQILSPDVLREMIGYASRHRVQVVVFNEALLEMGATMSSTSVESDIASAIVIVLEDIFNGGATSVPEVSPLTEIENRINKAVLRRYGLYAEAPGYDNPIGGAR